MDKIRQAGFFDVKVGGVVWTMRRRHTGLMMKIGDVRRVLGLVAGANAPERSEAEREEAAEKSISETVRLHQGMFDHAVTAADGVPIEETGITFEEFAPYAGALFSEFMGSGLTVDPMPDS